MLYADICLILVLSLSTTEVGVNTLCDIIMMYLLGRPNVSSEGLIF